MHFTMQDYAYTKQPPNAVKRLNYSAINTHGHHGNAPDCRIYLNDPCLSTRNRPYFKYCSLSKTLAMEREEEITRVLQSLQQGDEAALDQLFASLYAHLRNMAHAQRRGWSEQNTLHTTALVHEAYLKLSDSRSLKLSDRGHFFAVAARAMRQILINHAEKRRAAKRGGHQKDLPLEEQRYAVAGAEDELLALDVALNKLEAFGERQCRVVECRFFAGLNVIETAEALDISPATVKRDWSLASAWLLRELSEKPT